MTVQDAQREFERTRHGLHVAAAEEAIKAAQLALRVAQGPPPTPGVESLPYGSGTYGSGIYGPSDPLEQAIATAEDAVRDTRAWASAFVCASTDLEKARAALHYE